MNGDNRATDLSLRDHIAIEMAKAIVASGDFNTGHSEFRGQIATRAYQLADALIRESR